MKFIHSLAVLFVSQQILFSQSLPAIQGPVDFKFIVTEQVNFGATSQTAKSNAISTNISTTVMEATSNHVLDNAALLLLISDNFPFPFQPGATLILDQNTNFVVVIGTNVVMNLSNLLTLTPDFNVSVFNNNSVISGSHITQQRIDRKGTSEQTDENYIETTVATLNYDDSSVTWLRPRITQFSVRGIEKQHFKITGAGTNRVVTNFMTFTGVGDGIVLPNGSFERPIILRGEFVGKLSGSTAVP
jgi:hypothetical protein